MKPNDSVTSKIRYPVYKTLSTWNMDQLYICCSVSWRILSVMPNVGMQNVVMPNVVASCKSPLLHKIFDELGATANSQMTLVMTTFCIMV
jgi:hypothetical protein